MSTTINLTAGESKLLNAVIEEMKDMPEVSHSKITSPSRATQDRLFSASIAAEVHPTRLNINFSPYSSQSNHPIS
jgi:hypothetical protein